MENTSQIPGRVTSQADMWVATKHTIGGENDSMGKKDLQKYADGLLFPTIGYHMVAWEYAEY